MGEFLEETDKIKNNFVKEMVEKSQFVKRAIKRDRLDEEETEGQKEIRRLRKKALKIKHWRGVPGKRPDMDMYLPFDILLEIDNLADSSAHYGFAGIERKARLANMIVDFIDRKFVGENSELRKSVKQEFKYKLEGRMIKLLDTWQAEIDTGTSNFLLELKRTYPEIKIGPEIQRKIERIMQTPDTNNFAGLLE